MTAPRTSKAFDRTKTLRSDRSGGPTVALVALIEEFWVNPLVATTVSSKARARALVMAFREIDRFIGNVHPYKFLDGLS
jgi:hypothetical protein